MSYLSNKVVFERTFFLSIKCFFGITICYPVRDPTWNDINRVSCSSSTCQVVKQRSLHLLVVVQMHGKSALLLSVKEVNLVCTIRAEVSQSQTKPKPSAGEVRASAVCHSLHLNHWSAQCA